MKPNFFIAGVPKSGTTTIYHYLEEHPEVFMSSDKEPHFLSLKDEKFESVFGDTFSYKTLRKNPYPIISSTDYEDLFRSSNFKRIGEASTLYLYSKLAPMEIKKRFNTSDLRVIIILRNPVDRGYSQFLHHVREGFEWDSNFLSAAIDKRSERLKCGPFWDYIGVGKYYEQFNNFLKFVESEKLLIIKYEEFKNDNSHYLKLISEFLEIEFIEPTTPKNYNATGVPKNEISNSIINLLKHSKLNGVIKRITPKSILDSVKNYRESNLIKIKLEDDIREKLIKEFTFDIMKTSELINIDLTDWIEI